MNQEQTLARLFPEIRLPASVAAVAVSGVVLDSRIVRAGDLFIALSGSQTDGRAYIEQAIDLGAVAVAVEADNALPAGQVLLNGRVPVIPVPMLAARISSLAGMCYGNPSQHLQVVGVTGTNGKSTTVSLIAQLVDYLGGKAASIGTLGVVVNGAVVSDTGLTTPDAASCQKWLSELVGQGVQVVAMEVSSHGLDQHRVAGIQFEAGVFTNISHDHLDYHGSIKSYALAKQRLFQTVGLRSAIINGDDPFASQMMATAKKTANVFCYSLLDATADIYACNVHYSPNGTQFNLQTPWGQAEVSSPLLGEFNVYNLTAAIAVLGAKGFEFGKILAQVPKLHPVPGRMQKNATPSDISVVVDYAHTPDALAQAIAATRVHTSGRLWVVFGCGGDRDRTKRPAMAKVAEQYADRVVVTSDNPRTENPTQIFNDIQAGFSAQAFELQPDRHKAITTTIAAASPGDVILIAGKGHEKYQIIGHKKIHFDDVAVAEAALALRLPAARGA